MFEHDFFQNPVSTFRDHAGGSVLDRGSIAGAGCFFDHSGQWPRSAGRARSAPNGSSAPALLADRAYDANSLRNRLAERGVKAAIPPRPTCRHPHTYDAKADKGRNLIARKFCRPNELGRVATRCDKRADIDRPAILLAAALTWRIN
ncbi:MAG: transposase [Proteobacteria bacterium]|nr:transposase [Pseudomonadota bacterium]